MHRFFAFVAALTLTALSVSSSCLAGTPDTLHFRLQPSDVAGRIQLSLASERNSLTSSSVELQQLTGLEAPVLMASSSSVPVRFALIRDAGTIHCTGNGRNGVTSGLCSFAPRRAFADLLAKRGLPQPTEHQLLDLTLVDTRSKLVDALAAAGYQLTDVDDLVSVAALNISASYVAELGQGRFRPRTLEELIEFAALGITPNYASAMASSLPGVSAANIVSLKAVGVTPAYIAEISRVGLRDLTAAKVVELKAVGVSAGYAASIARAGFPKLTADRLIEFRALGVTPEYVLQLRRHGLTSLTPTQLVELRAIGFEPVAGRP